MASSLSKYFKALVNLYNYLNAYMHVCIFSCCNYVWTCVCILCKYESLYLFMYVCMYVCMHAWMYMILCMHVCIMIANSENIHLKIEYS